jgi:hypothetical protein
MKKILLTIIGALGLAIGPAQAGVIIFIDNPNRTATAGDTLYFTGTVTNDSLTDPVSLDFDNINWALASGTVVDHFFDAAFPVSLGAAGTSGDIALFEIVLSNPLIDASGRYGGTYEIDSGVDGFLGQANFSVTLSSGVSSTPEPGTGLLIVTIAIGLLFVRGRRRQSA